MAKSDFASTGDLWKKIARTQGNARVGFLEEDEVKEFLSFLKRLTISIGERASTIVVERAAIAGRIGFNNGGTNRRA